MFTASSDDDVASCLLLCSKIASTHTYTQGQTHTQHTLYTHTLGQRN